MWIRSWAIWAAEIDVRLVERLVDGILYAFRRIMRCWRGGRQAAIVLNGFGTVVNELGLVKPYLAKKSAGPSNGVSTTRVLRGMQAADLASRIALVVMQCGEEDFDLFGCHPV